MNQNNQQDSSQDKSRMKLFLEYVKRWRLRLAKYVNRRDKDEAGTISYILAKWTHIFTLSLRKFNRDFCIERAASLSYVMILSMIPLLVLFLSIANVLGIDKEIHQYIQNTVLPFVAPEFQTELSEIIIDYISPTIFIGARSGLINLVAILGLILGSMGVLITAERVFNHIWNVTETRGFFQKLTAFWVVLTTSPFLILASIWIADILSPADSYIAALTERWLILRILYDHLIPFTVSFFAYTLFFVFLPSTRVKIRSAAIGGLVSALLWEVSKRGFYQYVIRVGTVTNFYKQIATVPMFFFWVFVTWIIILLGAEISYVYQHYHLLRQEEDDGEDEPVYSKAYLAVSLLFNIYDSFRRGQEIPALDKIAEKMRVRVEPLMQLANYLSEIGVLIADAGQMQRYTLARAADTINIQQIVKQVSEQEFPADAESCPDTLITKQIPKDNVQMMVNCYFAKARNAYNAAFDTNSLAESLPALAAEEKKILSRTPSKRRKR
jgi:membrane protein